MGHQSHRHIGTLYSFKDSFSIHQPNAKLNYKNPNMLINDNQYPPFNPKNLQMNPNFFNAEASMGQDNFQTITPKGFGLNPKNFERMSSRVGVDRLSSRVGDQTNKNSG